MTDPYQALGVAKGASDKEIKSAYRKLAKELHPDKNKDNPRATERFSDVTKAYDLLLDKDKRAQFDRGEIDAEGNPTAPFGFGGGGGGYHRGPAGQQPDFGNAGADFGDIFEGLFGGGGGGSPFGTRQRSAPPPKGANVAYRLNVEFSAAATLQKQRITLEDGKTIDLSLPEGVEEGTQMRLGGKGRAGPGGNGDAIVTIHINRHPFFERDGDNIRLELPISLKEAVEGAKIKVPTVDGPVMLSIPTGSDSGKTLRLKDKGFHSKSGTRGNQLVTLMITLPDNDKKLAEFVKDWNPKDNPRASMGV
ncbi:MAG: DnaJ domain-containing protein [Sphingomonadales bacterium]|nr:DnaJ domain-containing protein [Sphingomonadales bacterium]PIX66686.1 MAG: molecular chaperone DnaJ [Sphingomonadales bacterium CG_4_10_14_3_um_filter_58_15]NCO48506.1 DnaJ domain-containing protein [Sphingomonadales bacterium]NCO99322.1 DnaJ domain-containing protein [Sphingomonadales bacterium]NCP27881.1 DnaJ domain-containing protein [Sphingomonadales bacterium]